jgi:hypothetical protein
MRNELKAHINKGSEGLSPLFLEAMADYYKGPKSPASKAPKSQRTPQQDDRRHKMRRGNLQGRRAVQGTALFHGFAKRQSRCRRFIRGKHLIPMSARHLGQMIERERE